MQEENKIYQYTVCSSLDYIEKSFSPNSESLNSIILRSESLCRVRRRRLMQFFRIPVSSGTFRYSKSMRCICERGLSINLLYSCVCAFRFWWCSPQTTRFFERLRPSGTIADSEVDGDSWLCEEASIKTEPDTHETSAQVRNFENRISNYHSWMI